DEAFQRKCFGKIFEFKQRGGTIVFVSHDAGSVERLCERAVLLREGRVAFDGPTRDAIVRYQTLLADEEDPDERGAGLREWGSGGALRRPPRRRRARPGASGGPLVAGGDRRRAPNRTGNPMSSRTCPDWPLLMELAPDLQFKHYTVAEAKLPAEALVGLPDVPLSAIAICCDLDRHVFYAAHTEPQVAEALRETHWFELAEWSTSGPGSGVS